MCEVPAGYSTLEQSKLAFVTEVGQHAPVLRRHEINVTSAHSLEVVPHETA
jgi:hypothetical protein